MKKYFYADGSITLGPFTLDELSKKNITRETMVWYQELGQWTPAGAVPELTNLFELLPPPAPTTNQSIVINHKEAPPKTWLVESILATLLCCLPFGIAGIVHAAKVESKFYAGDMEGAIKASEEARKWTSLSFWVGLLIGIIYFVYRVLISGNL